MKYLKINKAYYLVEVEGASIVSMNKPRSYFNLYICSSIIRPYLPKGICTIYFF